MKQNSSQKRKTKGFTLVELIVVIAILAILSAVGAVAYTGYINYANKGVDKDLVGEIIHAIDLAGYSYPDSTGSAMIVLTADSAPKILGSASEEVKAALTDAFGDIDSIRLTYDKWGNPVPADLNSVVSGIQNNDTVKKYLNNIETKGASSFAGSVDEIWDIVSTLVNGLNGKADMFEGVKVDTEGANDYLERIVEKTTTIDSSTFLNAWKSGSAFELFEPVPSDPSKTQRATSTELGATLTRNYAFYLYAKTHPSLTEDMKEDLEKLRVQGGYDYFSASFKSSGNWSTIISDYQNSNKAEQDAQAFLALMQAAKEVKTAKGGTPLKDDDYLSAMSGYIPMVGSVLSGDITPENLISPDYNLSSVTDGVIINVKSVDGLLTVPLNGVVSEDADPREKEIVVKYNKTIKIGSKNQGSGDKGTLVLSLEDESYKTGTINSSLTITGDPTVDKEGVVSISVTGKIITVTAVGKGSATITFKGPEKRGGQQPIYTVHVEVH